MPPMPEAAGERTVESTIYDLSARLQRSEENAQFMHIKQQAMMDTVTRLLHFNQELTRAVLALAPNPDTPVHRDGEPLDPSLLLHILTTVPSNGPPRRNPTTNRNDSQPRRTARAPLHLEPPILHQPRQPTCIPPPNGSRRRPPLPTRRTGPKPTTTTKLLPPPSCPLQPLYRHSPPLRLYRWRYDLLPDLFPFLLPPALPTATTSRPSPARQCRAAPILARQEAHISRHPRPRLATPQQPAPLSPFLRSALHAVAFLPLPRASRAGRAAPPRFTLHALPPLGVEPALQTS